MHHNLHARFLRILLCSLWIVGQSLNAQNVSVTLLPPPPNQMHLSDLWHILLFNNDNTTYKIYLRATGYEGSDKSGKLIADAQTRVIELPASRTPLRVTGTMVQPVTVNKSDARYESIIRSTGTVPSGEYYFCVNIIDAGTGVSLAEDCLDQVVLNTSGPMLVAPLSEEPLQDTLPTFSWLPPTPVSAGTQVRYRLRIVEIYGDQSPEQAMLSNPSWFERSDLLVPMMTYPFTARSFLNDKKYAWFVSATDGSNKASLGESEVWWFTRHDTSTQKSLAADSVPNPVTIGILSAGDQFTAGVFETVHEQRVPITNLKNNYEKVEATKTQIASNSNFQSDVLFQNINARDVGETTVGAATSGITNQGQNQNRSNFQLNSNALQKVKTSLGDLLAKPSTDHMLWLWGRNVESQVGFLAPAWFSDQPLPYDIQNIEQLASGANHVLALLNDGTVWAWGDNQFGELANNTMYESSVALKVTIPGPGKVIQVAAGMATSYALKADGTLYAWGYNANHELGIEGDTLHEQITPRKVNPSGVVFARVAARGGHAMAIATSGEVYSWGSNYFGEVGAGSPHTRISVPVHILESTDLKDQSASTRNLAQNTISSPRLNAFKSISCGDHFSFAMGASGNDVFAWGRNASGQLGLASTKDTAVPTRLSLSSVDTIAAGGAHTIFVMKDRSVRACGSNLSGQLGETVKEMVSSPKALSALGQVVALSCGASHSVYIRKSGGVWTMGQNNSGQLGYGPISDLIFSNTTISAPKRLVSLEQ